MSAEGPVRKPSGSVESVRPTESVRASDPPDVDSLMSRLDGEERDDSADRSPDSESSGRPSAAELLGGGRTRGRTKRTIRVPDDAVPAGTPPTAALKRSNPPPPMPAPVAEDLLQRPSFIPAEEVVRITPSRIISVGEGPPPVFPQSVRPQVNTLPSSNVTAPIMADAASPGPIPAYAPTSDVRLAATPSDPPVALNKIKPLTVPNLDAQVREALALLDREDFEVPVDITDAEEDGKPPQSNEESLGDEELEVVEGPTPSKKVVSAPTPPPRRAGSSVPNQPVVASTLPTGGTSEPPSSQPKIVVAAAATVASTPAASAMGPAPSPAAAAASTPPVADSTAEVKKKKRQWFEDLFNDDYARTLPKLDDRYLEREVRFIEDALGCDKGATILDLGCGPGEQAVALAGRGYEVIGIDLSLAMLARAADEAADKNQRINFLQGDMRDLTFDDAFDGIYCWGTTFGYFDDVKNAEVIQKIHKALRRGGRFLLDVVNRDYIAARMPSMVWFEGDGCVCMDEAQLNGITSRLIVKRTMMMEDGRQREIEYSIRLYSLHELGKVLHDNGFRVAEASGDSSTPGKYFGSESPRLLILAEKR
jgi:SAM-dependent methyltransferase